MAAIPGPPTTKAGPGEDVFGAGMIKFQDSDLLQVLLIYQDLTGRTVLRPETLPVTKINVRSQTPMTRREAVWLLDAVLSVNGIRMTPESEKFVFAAPKSRTQALPKFDPQAATAKARKTVPPVPLKFAQADATELLGIYAYLLGCKAVPLERNFPTAKFSLLGQGQLTQAEAIFALEAVASLNNLRLQVTGEDAVEIVPSGAAQGDRQSR